MKKTLFLGIFFFIVIRIINTVEFKFIVIGDTRPPFGTNTYQTFDKQIELINSLKPDFIINVGDLIMGYGSDDNDNPWEAYDKVVSKIKSKYYQIPGNHDIYFKEGEEIYREKFKKMYYSFDYKNSHFIFCLITAKNQYGDILVINSLNG